MKINNMRKIKISTHFLSDVAFIVIGLSVTVISMASSFGVLSSVDSDHQEVTVGKELQAKPNNNDLMQIQSRIQVVSQKVFPSVVAIRVDRKVIGSGVIVSKDGLVLTSGHVTMQAGLDADFYFVDGKRARGKTLGACRWADASLAKITDPGNWPHVEMAAINDFQVDDWVFAYGHPLGYLPNRPPPLRVGRIVQIQPDTIHTDCCIVIGDSGGPLFNLDGKVVGINSRVPAGYERPDLTYHVSINIYHQYLERMLNGEVWANEANGRYNVKTIPTLEKAIQTIQPSVVRLQAEYVGNRQMQRQQRGGRAYYRDIVLGTIVDPDGFIITKASEIANLNDNLVCILVKDQREERHRATVINVDRQHDIALIKINQCDLPAIDLTEKQAVESNAAPTEIPTSATVTLPSSSTNKKILPVGTFVITPLPKKGIMQNQPAERPYLMGVVSLSQRTVALESVSLGVTFGNTPSNVTGVQVQQVIPRSLAGNAGIRSGDIITHINSVPCERLNEIIETIRTLHVDDELKLTIQRNDETLDVAVTLDESSISTESRDSMNLGGELGISRVRQGFDHILQHDSALRAIDCGGPLVTLDGEVIGINIARAGRTETYALPIDQLRDVVGKLKNNK